MFLFLYWLPWKQLFVPKLGKITTKIQFHFILTSSLLIYLYFVWVFGYVMLSNHLSQWSSCQAGDDVLLKAKWKKNIWWSSSSMRTRSSYLAIQSLHNFSHSLTRPNNHRIPNLVFRFLWYTNSFESNLRSHVLVDEIDLLFDCPYVAKRSSYRMVHWPNIVIELICRLFHRRSKIEHGSLVELEYN